MRGVIPGHWPIKDSTNAKRLVEQYEVATIIRMIDHWMVHAPIKIVANFGAFYANRVQVQVDSEPKDYEWN